MSTNNSYDIAITGGGLGGLSLAIQAAQAGYRVILFEKEKYPFHKVCGEYVSLESKPFLERIGLPLDDMDLPLINRLIVSSPNGNYLSSSLEPGGFGISRYLLDHELCKLAIHAGAEIVENTKVSDIIFDKDHFTVKAGSSEIIAKTAVGAFGKRSNLDVKWSRDIVNRSRLNNYIAVKYHVLADGPASEIALHNFKDGYCGISKVEGNKYCLCYLTTAANLNKQNNSIKQMEKNILCKNPFLNKIFATVTIQEGFPITISQVSFSKKSQVQDHILLVGDAAGMITPLCGNGMSMAMHAGTIAFKYIDLFLKGRISRQVMEENYTKEWNTEFGRRLRNGRIIQRLFGSESVTNLFIAILKTFPSVVRRIISSTHGAPF